MHKNNLETIITNYLQLRYQSNQSKLQQQYTIILAMSEALNTLILKATTLSKLAIPDTIKTSYNSYQKGYENYIKSQGISNPEAIIDITPNHIVAYLIHHFEEKNNKARYINNIRSGIKSHYKRNLRAEDRQRYDATKQYYIGNPCDSIVVKEIVSGADNISKDRGDQTKWAAPITMKHLNALWIFMLSYFIENALF